MSTDEQASSNPYLPPESDFVLEPAPIATPHSKWLYWIAAIFSVPLLLLGSIGLLEELNKQSRLHPTVFLFGIALAGGMLLNASAPFAMCHFCKQYWRALNLKICLRLYLFAYLYALPFSVAGFFWLSRPEANTDLALLLTSITAFSFIFGVAWWCWFMLMYGLMAWRLRFVARRAAPASRLF